MQDVDAGDGVERDGDVEVEVAGLGIVDAEAVDEDEGLLEGGAADGEVGLDAFGGAGLHVERRVGAEQIDGAVDADGQLARGEDFDGAVAFGQGERLDGGGDLDAVDDDQLFGWRGGGGLRVGRRWWAVLGEASDGPEQDQGEAGEGVLHRMVIYP